MIGPSRTNTGMSMKDLLGIKDDDEKAEDEKQKAREKTTWVIIKPFLELC